MNSFEKETPSIDPAIAVEEIRMQAMQMGANDYESSAFDQIQKDLREGKYKENPGKAIEKAQAILDSKQSYH